MNINEALSKSHQTIFDKLYDKYENDFDEALGNDDVELMDLTLTKFRRAAKKMGAPKDKVETWITDQLHPEAMNRNETED